MKNPILKVAPLALALCFGISTANASIIQIGDGSTAALECDIAIGDGANSAGGHGADYPNFPSSYYCALAVGTNATATGSLNSAYGTYANASGGTNATAVGAFSNAGSWEATAVGASSSATATDSSAFGFGANAAQTNSVALGAYTQTIRANEVAVGYRQIGQVADGTLDDDAVNLRQLNAAIAGIVIPPAGADPYFKATGLNDGTDDAVVNGNDSVVAGARARTNGANTTALGAGADADADDATTVGAGSHAGLQATAFGSLADAGGELAVAGGKEASAGGYGGVALGFLTNASGTQAVSIGYTAAATGTGAVAFGAGALGSGELATAIGPGSQATATQSAAVGFASQANHDNSVAIGSFTVTDRANEVAMGYRQVGQVANGTLDNDAVNISQLAPVAAFFGGGASFTGGIWTPPTFALPSGASFNNVNDALIYLDGRIGTGSGEPGPVGPVGPQGADGRSAYEVAVANGFNGTETEWLASLQGADGQDGSNGRDGAAGGTNKLVGGKNITVTDNDDGTQTASLNDNIKLSDQGSVQVGKTTVDAEGVKIEGGASITTQGVDAGSQRITHVANGRIEQGSMDAVNGGQLWDLERNWDDRWTEVNNRLDRTNKRMDGLGAQMGAMSMMAATPGEGGLTVGVGMSGSQAAMAVGWSRRVNDRISVSAGASFGGGNKPVIGGAIRIGGH